MQTKVVRWFVVDYYDGPLEALGATADGQHFAAFRPGSDHSFQFYIAMPLSTEQYNIYVQSLRGDVTASPSCWPGYTDQSISEELERQAYEATDLLMCRHLWFGASAEGPCRLRASELSLARELLHLRPMAPSDALAALWRAARQRCGEAPRRIVLPRFAVRRWFDFFATREEMIAPLKTLMRTWDGRLLAVRRPSEMSALSSDVGQSILDPAVSRVVMRLADSAAIARLRASLLRKERDPPPRFPSGDPFALTLWLPAVGGEASDRLMMASLWASSYMDSKSGRARFSAPAIRALRQVRSLIEEMVPLSGPVFAEGWPFPIRQIRVSAGAAEWERGGGRLVAHSHLIRYRLDADIADSTSRPGG